MSNFIPLEEEDHIQFVKMVRKVLEHELEKEICVILQESYPQVFLEITRQMESMSIMNSLFKEKSIDDLIEVKIRTVFPSSYYSDRNNKIELIKFARKNGIEGLREAKIFVETRFGL